MKKMFISTSKEAISDSLSAMSNLLDKLEFVNKREESCDGGGNDERRKKYLIQITDETPELRISLFDQLDQNHFRIEYFFKEISTSENESIYYAYFIRKI